MKHWLLSLLMIFSASTILAQADLSQYKFTSPNEVIEFEGENVQFKMMNVCEDDFIFGFPKTDSTPAMISRLRYNLNMIDSFPNENIITGVSGVLGWYFYMYITTDNTLYKRKYRYENGSALKTASDSITIPNIFILYEDPQNWGGENPRVIQLHNDSLIVSKVNENPLRVDVEHKMQLSTLLTLDRDVASNKHLHITGLNSANQRIYYNTIHLTAPPLVIDSVPGDLIFANKANDIFVISQTGDSLFVTMFDTFHIFITPDFLGEFSGIRDVHKWSNTQIGILVDYTDTLMPTIFSQLHIYNCFNWGLDSIINLPFRAKRLLATSPSYSSWYNQQYIIYTDSSGAYLNYNSGTKIPSSNPTYTNFLWTCFSGIEDKPSPTVKTFVYPNPASDQFHVVVKNVPCDMEHHLELFDLHGKLIYRTPFFAKCDITIPAENLASGMYILKMNIDGQIHTRKLVKR